MAETVADNYLKITQIGKGLVVIPYQTYALSAHSQ